VEKISFVILNYKRPKNLIEHIIPSLLINKLTDKIIISHALEETYFDNYSNDEKVLHLKHFEENKKVGLYCRFLAFEKTNTNCIVFQDDDFLIDNDSIIFCHEKWLNEKNLIHGFRGRSITEDSYIRKDALSENTPVVLTQFAMTSSFIVKKAIEMSCLVEPYVQECNPIWNGEDIFLSIVSILQTKKFNKRYNLRFKEISTGNAIWQRKGHYEHRKSLVKKLFELFPELKEIFELNNSKN
jgi:hypothetical protein